MRRNTGSTSAGARLAGYPFALEVGLTLALVALLAPFASAQYIYVANAGEDTLSKIDINTMKEVARYRTWFGPSGKTGHVSHATDAWAGPAPSRVAVDAAGNVYVLNRFFYKSSTPVNHLPVLLKILPSGGTNTSTSDIPLDMEDTDPDGPSPQVPNNEIDPWEIKDDRIAWARPIGDKNLDRGMLGRSLCVDVEGNAWVGLFSNGKYYKVSPDGTVDPVPVLTPGHRPYGCVVDKNGILWSASSGETVAEFNTKNKPASAKVWPHPDRHNYSVSLINGCEGKSRIFFSDWTPGGSSRPGLKPNTYLSYDPATPGVFSAPPTAVPRFASLAVAVDLDGNILSGEWKTGRVIKTAPPDSVSPAPGTVLWDTDKVGSTVATTDLRGLVVDADNNVWAVHRTDNRLVRYDGKDGTVMHAPPYTKVGISPYTYSNPPLPNCPCGRIDKSSITCQGRNAGTGTYSWTFTFTNQSPFAQPATSADLTSSNPNVLFPPASKSISIPLAPPVPLNGQGTVSGTFTVANSKADERVCIDMRLSGGTDSWCCPKQQVCFTLPECRNCADAKAQFRCNAKGVLYLALTVINNGPTTAQGFQVFSTTPGVTVSPLNTNVALPPGVPVTVAINVTGASAGQAIDLTVNIHGPTNDKGVYSWCCTSSFRVTYPLKHLCTDVDGPPIDHNDPPVP